MQQIVRSIAIAITMTLLAACVVSTAGAQSNTATLTGTVTDTSGALVAHAAITITDQASGVKRTTASDDRGYFSLVGIPVGNYDIAVSAPCFNTLVRKGIAVHINDQVELKGIALPVASATESIVVTAT